MNLVELSAARAQKIYEYGEIAYEIRLLEQRLRIAEMQQNQILVVLESLEQQIDNLTEKTEISEKKDEENLEKSKK
jgi:hypothetical protein